MGRESVARSFRECDQLSEVGIPGGPGPACSREFLQMPDSCPSAQTFGDFLRVLVLAQALGVGCKSSDSEEMDNCVRVT